MIAERKILTIKYITILICMFMIYSSVTPVVTNSNVDRNEQIDHNAYQSKYNTRSTNDQILEKGQTLSAKPSDALAWGDMDNDGYLDLAIAEYRGTVKVFKSLNGTITKPATWQSDRTYTTTSLAWGDMNSDGYLELAVGCTLDYDDPTNLTKKYNLIFKNVDGLLGTIPDWFSGDKRNTSDIIWADFDKDGDMDLFAGNYGVGGFDVVYETKSNVVYPTPAWFPIEETWTESIAVGDMNSDGNLDLIIGSSKGDQNKIYLNHESKIVNIEKTPTWESADGLNTLDIEVGDLDNDGDLDIAAGTEDSAMCVVYYNNQSTFGPVSDWQSTDYGDCTSISLGDVDSDGDLDIAAALVNDQKQEYNYIFLNNNTFQQTPGWKSGDKSTTTEIAFADVDNDGDLDLGAVNNHTLDSTRIYMNVADKLPPTFSQYPTQPPRCVVNSPKGIIGGNIMFRYTLYDAESDPVSVRFQYSFANSPWTTANEFQPSGSLNYANMITLPTGKEYTFTWDTIELTEESDNVRFRILIQPKRANIGFYQYGTVVANTGIINYGEAPSKPSGFGFSGIGTNSIILSWNNNPFDEGVLGYELHINASNSSSEFIFLEDVGDTLSYAMEGLISNTSYYFKLRAYDDVPFYSGYTLRVGGKTWNQAPEVNISWKTRKVTISEDGYDNNSIDLRQIFIDPTPDPMIFSIINANNLTIKIMNNGSVQIIPDTDWHGMEIINFTADDGQWHDPKQQIANWFLLEVIVKSINDQPKILNPMGTSELQEDQNFTKKVFLPAYFGDSADGETLSYDVIGNNNITVTFTDEGYAELKPIMNWWGEEVITFVASDDNKSSASQDLTVIVHPVNDEPVITVGFLKCDTGKWFNYTFDVEDVDTNDMLDISIDIDSILTGLELGKNYYFDKTTGNLRLLPSKEMAGYYKLNLTVTDGTVTKQESVGLRIVDVGGSTSGVEGTSDKGSDQTTLFIIIIAVVIVIVVIAVVLFTKRKKPLKISFMKCPNCGQTMAQTGRNTFKCTNCNTIKKLDKAELAQHVSSQAKPASQVPTESPIDEGRVQKPKQHSMYDSTSPKVDGGYYPESILSGSVLDMDDEPSPFSADEPTTSVATPVTSAQPAAAVAQPVATPPPETPEATSDQQQAQPGYTEPVTNSEQSTTIGETDQTPTAVQAEEQQAPQTPQVPQAPPATATEISTPPPGTPPAVTTTPQTPSPAPTPAPIAQAAAPVQAQTQVAPAKQQDTTQTTPDTPEQPTTQQKPENEEEQQ